MRQGSYTIIISITEKVANIPCDICRRNFKIVDPMGLKLGVEKTEEGKGTHDHNRSIAPQETTKKKTRDATRGRGKLGYSSRCCINPPACDDVAAAAISTNKSKKLKAGGRQYSFSYDPKSYAHNFDEGNIDHDDDVQYSSRFAFRFADFSSMKEEK